MASYSVSKDCFWVKREGYVQIVVDSDPRVYTLDGLPQKIFLSIAEKQADGELQTHDKYGRIVADLCSLNFIQQN